MNFIKKLRLQNFRKYNDKEFTFDSPLTIIHAPNATGKTTILEAISILANGNSSWTSTNNDIYNYEAPDFDDKKKQYFRVSADISTFEDSSNKDLRNFALFQSPNKKQMQIDKHNTTIKKFHQNMAATIFSPEHIELLMISPKQRRDYLDQTISRIDYAYADDLKMFKKIHRQRNAFLKKLAKRFYESGFMPDVENDQQYIYWSEEFSKYSARLMYKRVRFVQKLISEDFRVDYLNSLELNEFEIIDDLEILAEKHLEALMTSAKRDIATGITNMGAHRDDWSIITSLEVKRFGSRGEKRMAIGKLIFLVQDLVAKELGFYPFLLLDDISSELDTENIKRVFSDEIMDKQQVFVTTVNLDGFEGMEVVGL